MDLTPDGLRRLAREIVCGCVDDTAYDEEVDRIVGVLAALLAAARRERLPRPDDPIPADATPMDLTPEERARVAARHDALLAAVKAVPMRCADCGETTATEAECPDGTRQDVHGQRVRLHAFETDDVAVVRAVRVWVVEAGR